jgi:preprotein translocase subunit Sec63
MENADTGERLQTTVELEAAKNLAQQQASEMEAAKNLALQQADEMAALLDQYREQFGDLPQNKSVENPADE